jgi:hypothetical protein
MRWVCQTLAHHMQLFWVIGSRYVGSTFSECNEDGTCIPDAGLPGMSDCRRHCWLPADHLHPRSVLDNTPNFLVLTCSDGQLWIFRLNCLQPDFCFCTTLMIFEMWSVKCPYWPRLEDVLCSMSKIWGRVTIKGLFQRTEQAHHWLTAVHSGAHTG